MTLSQDENALLPAKWLQQIDRYLIFFIAAVAIFLSLNIHKGNNINGVIWSDQEGYYVYYPAVVISETGFKKLPVRNGCTFKKDGRAYSKYTYGVALLESPFVTASHWIAKAKFDPENPDPEHKKMYEPNGFSYIYAYGILFAAIFWTMLGLWFLKEFLKRIFPLGTSLLTVFLVFFATNLLYYTVREGGMSHCYSFFLFSMFMYYLPGFLKEGNWKQTLLIGAAFGLSVVIRPTNIIIGLAFFLFDVHSLADLKARFKRLLTGPYLIRFGVMAVVSLILATPQLIYWQYMNGKPVAWTYQEEGFHNWKSPKMWKVLTSHQNGLFAYTPIALVMVAGLVASLFKKKHSGILIAALFVIATYIFGSWWAWWFGGAFGHRCYVEYYAWLAIPLAFFFTFVNKIPSKPLRWVIVLGFLGFVYANIYMTYLYSPPWDGPDWTFMRYWQEVIKPVIKFWDIRIG